MMMPSIFGENLFDDWMDDMNFGKFFNDQKSPVFGKHEKNLMKTDIKEKENSYELDMDLPGFKKEDVTAKLENGYITISAHRDHNKDEKDKAGNYIRQERYTGSCQRSFYVGETIKQEDISAKFENGILSLSIPKEDKKAIANNNFIAIEG